MPGHTLSPALLAFLLLIPWALESLANPIAGLNVLARSSTADFGHGTLSLPFRRRPSALISRSSYLPTTIDNHQLSYLVSVGVGTPPQSLYLSLDTGSSDTWFFSPQACTTGHCAGGTFDSSTSSTFTDLSTGTFLIQYNDNTKISGDYISDNLSLGGVTVESVEMALASTGAGSGPSSQTYGIMGVGYPSNEAGPAANEYPNIVQDLVSQGIISSYSYSLWLDDLASQTGTILFGGYNSAKFSGQLTVIDTLPDADGTVRSFLIALSSLNGSYNGQTTTLTSSTFTPVPALLDSGTSLILMPSAAYTIVANWFGANSDGTIDCGLADKSGSVSFGFAGVSIDVPFSELAVLDEDTQTCYFGFADGGPDSDWILGDTFLRSAYVYYDLGNNQIGLAQSVFQ
ncbi:hypothetical protein A1O3_02714 [Capronia epimyces CBS 606.96]|uniref:Peptidase A1 domain-containing protein n=1 Tax=Capronia epimyces CBS 606.96 TaxID=1182542 RepID=W9Y9W6_9EURO|nr:uncharacterized protein A1O3_02714 [Capronia epimyces CBS 606.96]EXJ89647.1 hypothetical protein A1O3_02714 [Capronia epimyces CBS 606.96]